MSAPIPLRFFIFLAAASAFSPWASAQTSSKSVQTAAICPAAGAMTASQLFGRWAVRYSHPPPGLAATATMVLKRHAEFSDSLAGTVTRPAPATQPDNQSPNQSSDQPRHQPLPPHPLQSALAGDLDGGFLLLDESSDHIRITASWNGEMVPGSCGTAFAGLWKDLSVDSDNTLDIPFTLTRMP
jgi:hypothetical protein